MHNILFLMTDQLRWDALGRTGGWVKTPNLDRIAGEGVLFTQCFTNAPVCIPARVSLATGLYPHNTGVCSNVPDFDLDPASSTWMQALRSAGYRTSLFGKTHLHRHSGDLRDREPLMRAYGFDDVDEIGGPRASMHVGSHMTEGWERAGLWDIYKEDFRRRFAEKPYAARPSPLPLDQYADVYVGRQARDYLERYDRPEPWFCMVSFGGPHEPWDAPEPYASMYDPGSMPAPVPRLSPTPGRKAGHLDRYFAPGDPHSPEASADEIAAMRANYAGNVTLIDDQIGELLRTLERRGELERTIIAFASDHGEMNGDHGLIYKEQFLNGAVRVPLIVRAPGRHGAAAGTAVDSPIELFDLGPTLVELGGGEWRTARFAKSFAALLDGRPAAHRDEALVEVHGEYMVQDREWKLAVNRLGEPYLLFDLANDPDEQRNLVLDPQYRGQLDAMQLRLLRRLVASQRLLPD
ncbi:sulfatase family protein [Paenibacillus sp.]|uniref:sulfatase family protein n=1 Tax=Paenibacillus sp. TaxID=58172 RepID=UPI002D5E5DCD|nr:sulfatase-like hydrolase/transferase [Paenibacillus sp.]HZG55557.1 sulfatase-like hydrolase/transferase [Paenibacillus sp.]